MDQGSRMRNTVCCTYKGEKNHRGMEILSKTDK